MIDEDYSYVYAEEVTNESLKELNRFCDWLDKIVGAHPLIIGGWAVYAYNPKGYGSRDIDVVMPNEKIKDRIINEYMEKSGYKKERFGIMSVMYYKPTVVNGKEFKIYLDVCTEEDENNFFGMSPKIEIPWRLARKYEVLKQIGESKIYAPCPEVLLLFKAKAFMDRTNKLKEPGDPLTSMDKIWKDAYDVASLIRYTKIEKELFDKLVAEYNLQAPVEKALSIISERKGVLSKITRNEKEAVRLKRAINSLVPVRRG